MADDWGPLGPMVGDWEGEGGLDTAFSHSREEVTITLNPDGTWSYDETTMLKMVEMDEPFAHTDHNTLHKVG